MVDSHEIVDMDSDPSWRSEPLLPSHIIKGVASFVGGLATRTVEYLIDVKDSVADDLRHYME